MYKNLDSFFCSLNARFLVLIYKKGRMEDVKDFRPISLVGSLKRVVINVISNNQNVFCGG